MFPLAPLASLPSAASQTDKTILGPKVVELVAAANALHDRLLILEPPSAPPPEPAPDPAPVASVEITALQQAALDGLQPGQVIELRGPAVLITLLATRIRVVVPAPPSAPGVPQIALSTSSIDGGQIAEGETTPVTGAIDVTNGGTGSLSGLGVSAVTYTQGSSGWLTPTWDAINQQADWSVDPTGLTPGNYAAFFDVTAGNAPPVRVTAILTMLDVLDPPGEAGAPLWSLPTFNTYDATSDDVDGEPYTPEPIGYFG